MTEHDDLDRRLARWFEADAHGPAPASRFEQAIEATRNRRPRPALVAGFGSAWVETGPAAAPLVSWRFVGATALLLLALTAAAAYVGSQPRRLPALVVPAGNGLIAYALGGDIFVGDPVSGMTKPVVTGPEADSSPIFSPDGTLIAFMRGDPWTENASVIVVREDGSDKRVVVPAGFSERGLGFAWAPDSASLVVNHDSEPLTTPSFDGELSLFDATGVDEPRLLTPPLPIAPGTDSLHANGGQVAAMFQPPDGSQILSGAGHAFDVFDADLRKVSRLSVGGSIKENEPYAVCCAGWSADGSLILFSLFRIDASGTQALGLFGSVVMNANGTDVRRLGRDVWGQWSPDSSRIAFARCSADPARPGAAIVIIEIATGIERVLDATSVETKTEGSVPAPRSSGEALCSWYSAPGGRNGEYEGWSWAPDGRSIVLLATRGTRPIVVDVETGRATELPWDADSAPSWQRVAADR